RMQAQLPSEGNIDFEEHRIIDPQGPFFQEVLSNMNHSHQKNRELAVVTVPRTPEFFRELTRRAAKNGWLSLWSFRLNDHLSAFEYQLRSNGKVQALWTGDDPAYRDLLPKNALQLAILRSLFEGGHIYEYSLGPGGQEDHPWWATAHQETVYLKIYRPGFYSRLLQRLEAA